MAEMSAIESSRLASDLLLSLPALPQIPEILLSVDRSDLDRRQCKTIGPSIPKESAISGITKQIDKLIYEHQEAVYGAKGDLLSYRHHMEHNEQDPSSFQLRTYVESLDSHNCTTTYVSELYNVCITSEQRAVVSGDLTVHTCFGEGPQVNVQTKLKKMLAERIIEVSDEHVNSIVAQFEKSTLNYEELLAKAIVKELLVFKDNLKVEETFAAANLKKIRRILPVTKTRFKWDSSAQRNVQLLNARQTQQS